MNCDADVSIIRDLFEDQTEESEVRIKSFIALMRCPGYKTLKFVERTLEREKMNQGRRVFLL